MIVPVITIDGPSGSGKGTVAATLAEILGWHLLDSGALYRLTALACRGRGVALDEVTDVADIAQSLAVRFVPAPQSQRVLLDGEDVTDAIREEAIGEGASRVAALPAVRTALLQRQRDFAQAPGLIADGRDMGSVVFPQAGVKVFLFATAEVRAQRRYKQLKEKSFDVSLPALLADIEQRDARDTGRSVAPLAPAEDAEMIDSSELDVPAVVARILALKNARFGIGRS